MSAGIRSFTVKSHGLAMLGGPASRVRSKRNPPGETQLKPIRNSIPLAILAALACSSVPCLAGELTADYGFPQIREVWKNEGDAPAKMDLEVTPKGNAICTFTVHPGGSSQKFDTDTGAPQKATFTVPGKGGIEVRAEKGSPKAKPKAGTAEEPTRCSYSISEAHDLSK